MIQDIIIAATAIAFSYALVPQVIDGFRFKRGTINLQTATITTIGLYVLSACFFSLGLIYATMMNLIAGSLWLLLLIQRLKYKETTK